MLAEDEESCSLERGRVFETLEADHALAFHNWITALCINWQAADVQLEDHWCWKCEIFIAAWPWCFQSLEIGWQTPQMWSPRLAIFVWFQAFGNERSQHANRVSLPIFHISAGKVSIHVNPHHDSCLGRYSSEGQLAKLVTDKQEMRMFPKPWNKLTDTFYAKLRLAISIWFQAFGKNNSQHAKQVMPGNNLRFSSSTPAGLVFISTLVVKVALKAGWHNFIDKQDMRMLWHAMN